MPAMIPHDPAAAAADLLIQTSELPSLTDAAVLLAILTAYRRALAALLGAFPRPAA